MSNSDADNNSIDKELLQAIMFEMIVEEKNNNKKEELSDVQMVDKLLKILEKKI